MPRPDRIEGLAIVSADGMIADAEGRQPPSLKIEADQRFFFEHLDRATALAHGRFSGEGGPGASGRRRLILTRRIAGIARDPQNGNALLWNPAGATLPEAWDALGLNGGTLGVIGGTEPFSLFLELGYDVFHLSRAARARLPGGRPVFAGIPPSTPEARLSAAGLVPAPAQMLDAACDLTLVSWTRLDPSTA